MTQTHTNVFKVSNMIYGANTKWANAGGMKYRYKHKIHPQVEKIWCHEI